MSEPASTEKEVHEETKEPVKESATDEGETAQNEAPAHEPSEEPKTDDKPEQAQPSQPPPPPPAAPKVKHDWYQTSSDVCVNVMIKRLKKDDVTVEFTEKSLRVQIQLGEGRECSLAFRLAHHIVPQRSSFKVLSTKVEIKMRKVEGLQWATLEEAEEQGKQAKLPHMEEAKDDVHKYPSSSHYTRNWDKLVAEVKQEEKDEKLEGDAALNKLFQQIYGDGSDEVKRAMNKSFAESGGTVLSTNWSEVGSKPVERKPPDGMEWRSYEN